MASHLPSVLVLHRLCASKTVYSMNGDIAPLQELVEAVENTLPKGCAQIFVDESHSTEMYGPAGRGIVHHLGLEKRVYIRLYTFSPFVVAAVSISSN
jgi:8-amino-7-oxononanoate synthase